MSISSQGNTPKSTSKSGTTTRHGPSLRTAPIWTSSSRTPVSSHSRSVGSNRGRERARAAVAEAATAENSSRAARRARRIVSLHSEGKGGGPHPPLRTYRDGLARDKLVLPHTIAAARLATPLLTFGERGLLGGLRTRGFLGGRLTRAFGRLAHRTSRRCAHGRRHGSGGVVVTHDLYVVALGIMNVRRVVVRVIVGAHARRAVVGGARRQRGGVESVDARALGPEREVRRAGGALGLRDPQIWFAGAHPDRERELHEDVVSQRRERGAIERDRPLEVLHPKTDVVDHVGTISKSPVAGLQNGTPT